MIVKLIFQFLVSIFLAFLIVFVGSFIWIISFAGKLSDFPERCKAKIYSRKWWLYVLIIAMFFTFMTESDKLSTNKELIDSLRDGFIFLILGFFLRSEAENIVMDKKDKEKKIREFRWLGNISLFSGIFHLFITGSIYFMKITAVGYIDPWWSFLAIGLVMIFFRKSASKKRGNKDIEDIKNIIH